MNTLTLQYLSCDGEIFSGNTAFQVVDAMREAGVMTEHKSLDGYLHAAAFRFSVTNNVVIRADSPENFLADLETAGILTRVTR